MEGKSPDDPLFDQVEKKFKKMVSLLPGKPLIHCARINHAVMAARVTLYRLLAARRIETNSITSGLR